MLSLDPKTISFGSAPLLELQNVTKGYPGVLALDDISLKIRSGETLAIAGANGAGKSTLVRLIAGVETPDRGKMTLQGRPLRLNGPRDAIDQGIHTIHQELHLAQHLSVAENIFLGRMPKTAAGLVDWLRLHGQAEALLEKLGVNMDIRQPVSSLRRSQAANRGDRKVLGTGMPGLDVGRTFGGARTP